MKVKCENCTHAFLTLSEILPDACCANEKTNICNEDHVWNKNLRNSKRLRYCKGYSPFPNKSAKNDSLRSQSNEN